jgi:hypothetical protein
MGGKWWGLIGAEDISIPDLCSAIKFPNGGDLIEKFNYTARNFTEIESKGQCNEIIYNRFLIKTFYELFSV